MPWSRGHHVRRHTCFSWLLMQPVACQQCPCHSCYWHGAVGGWVRMRFLWVAVLVAGVQRSCALSFLNVLGMFGSPGLCRDALPSGVWFPWPCCSAAVLLGVVLCHAVAASCLNPEHTSRTQASFRAWNSLQPVVGLTVHTNGAAPGVRCQLPQTGVVR
jgi:hypothetical protein